MKQPPNSEPSAPTEEELARIRAEAMSFANVGIYRYRPDGTLLFIDLGAVRLLDLQDEVKDPADLIGRNVASLLGYVGEPGRLRRAVFEKGSVKDFEYHYRTNKGEDRWVYHSAYQVTDTSTGGTAIQVIARDITEIKRTALALASSEQRYRTLVESSQQGLAVLGGEPLKVVLVNSAFTRLIGLSKSALIDCDLDLLLDRFHPKDRELASACFLKNVDSQFAKEPVEVRLLDTNGNVTWVSVLSASIDLDGGKAVQATLLDITARREAERRRREVEEQINRTQRLESLGVLAGGIAHDFNNLLMAILGNAELARIKIAADADIQRYLKAIADTSQRGADLCRQLLIYSGGRSLTVQPIDLNHIVKDTNTLLSVSISKKAQIDLALMEALPLLAGDPSQLRQVVMNLVVNASEALGERPGTIVLRTGVDHLHPGPDSRYALGLTPAPGEYVYIEVEDDGCGMDEATQSRVFEPFFSTKFTGRGLGLAAVLGIVRAHRGAIDLDSYPERGTRLRLLFPTMPYPAPTSSPPDTSSEWTGTGTALIVDDEATARIVTSGLVEALGFECVQAVDGKQALDLLITSPKTFSLVLLDVLMPILDGRECVRALRELYPELPVLFMSGHEQDAVSEEMARYNRISFLQKPFGLEDLRNSIQRLIENRESC